MALFAALRGESGAEETPRRAKVGQFNLHAFSSSAAIGSAQLVADSSLAILLWRQHRLVRSNVHNDDEQMPRIALLLLLLLVRQFVWGKIDYIRRFHVDIQFDPTTTRRRRRKTRGKDAKVNV